MKRLPVERHLTADRVRAEYRACRHPIEKVRRHAIRLLLRADGPRTPARVGEPVGLSVITVRDVLHRWNDHGPGGLADCRKGNGSEPKLAPTRRAELLAGLGERPPDGGAWSGPKVARYAADRWDVRVCPQTGWVWPRELGFTLQVPRPARPNAADAPTRARWKKTRGGGWPG